MIENHAEYVVCIYALLCTTYESLVGLDWSLEFRQSESLLSTLNSWHTTTDYV